jgi:hypothetical protein
VFVTVVISLVIALTAPKILYLFLPAEAFIKTDTRQYIKPKKGLRTKCAASAKRR